MPVYNGAGFIRQSLPPLAAMLERKEIIELLIVDDGSTDDSVEIARAMQARILSTNGRLGPGAARNLAAGLAEGDVLWFIDADVVVHDDAARIIGAEFANNELDAVFGSYDNQPPAENFLSQYKNLVHHFYHQQAKKNASTFWSGCGAIRKKTFLAVGGFDVETFKHPSIEDIELGYRVCAAGGRIHLLTELQCTHLKVWRFVNLVHTEFFRRALPWSRLIIQRSGLINDLNVGARERVKALIAALFVFVLIAAVFGILPIWSLGLAFAVVTAANWDLALCFFRRQGVLFALGGLLYHQIYYLYSSAAFAWALLEHHLFAGTPSNP
ncbi:MAG: glycosyltransferase [Methylococcaceae bacterium]|nr:glycosyltransferase [Methylococcaceae bacterium]